MHSLNPAPRRVLRLALAGGVVGLGTLLALEGAPADAAGDPRAVEVEAVSLDRRPELLSELSLPDASRPDEPGRYAAISGDAWRLVATVDGVRTWEAALPVRPRTLFFHRPPDDMALLQRDDGETAWEDARSLRYRRGPDDHDTVASWEFTTHAVRVRRDADRGRPFDGEYAVRYRAAGEREAGLQRSLFDGDDEAFVFRAAQVDDTTRHGLFLPAPASATFTLTVPKDGVLDMQPGMLPPELAPLVGGSDGAELVVSVDGAEVSRHDLRPGWFDQARVDLSAWGGQEVALELAVEPGGDADYDYAFVATPTVHRPLADPPRVIIVFIDTMRQDGMSLYGYERETSPHLDAWAQDAAVFETARSVAPWTLPSTRAMFLGDQPERWGLQDTLQERAARAGWATAFIAGNVYLSSNFEMDRGWGTHRCINWPNADVQVDRALEWLDDHADRPALMTLHLMDMHLPYTEPAAYKEIWAGERPGVLSSDDFHRKEVVADVRKLGDDGKQYVRDRYDQNLVFIDDELDRFLSHLGPDDTVVIMSDHGEEFWDHDGFEHGHTLYEELLRVPLVVKAPGMQAGRYDAPVSLVDIAPTLAQVMGLSADDMFGMPLQGAADGSTVDAFASRPVGIGRPLYGLRSWGVIADGHKYWSQEGRERLFDLVEDPAESRDLVRRGTTDPAPWRPVLGDAVDRPSGLALRVEVPRSSQSADLAVKLRVPGGVVHAWAGDDPLNYADVEVDIGEVDAEGVQDVTLTWVGKSRGGREAYVLPKLPMAEALPGIEIRSESGRDKDFVPPSVDLATIGEYSGRSEVLWRGRSGGRRFVVDQAVVPIPDSTRSALVGMDEEQREALKALGYMEE